MASYTSVDVKCPFYLRHDRQTCRLWCAGMDSADCTRLYHFNNGKAFRRQFQEYCAGDYRRCLWAQMLEAREEAQT